MAYGLNFAALCAQVHGGQTLLSFVAGHRRVQTLFDEAMPEYGLPSGTFTAVRERLARVRDESFLAIGDEWYEDWIQEHLRGEQPRRGVGALVTAQRERASSWIGARATIATVENKSELVRSLAFEQWMPVQREAAEWFGDTRVVPAERRLISDAQLEELAGTLRPGDIIVERRNWYLSNIGLPGFWPHAALYVGTQAQMRELLDHDPAVREVYGAFTEHLAREHPEAWRAFGQRDHEGHPHVVLEAVSEGVVAASLEHSCGADYVAAMRPRLSPVETARAIERAFSYFGRPYDFNFDFATDDEVVCSELVMKAYEGTPDGAGRVEVPAIEVAGRTTIPPTEIVRTFARELERDDRQLDFVAFLDGRERTDHAVAGTAASLAASAERPKWDVLQP
jgi:hypothetical protein